MTTKGICETLQKQHLDKSIAKKIFLMHKFFMSWMEPHDIMKKLLKKLGVMANELNAI
jgi:hypothetical protein